MFRISFTFLLTTAKNMSIESYTILLVLSSYYDYSVSEWLATHIREGNNSQYYNEQYPIPTAAAS